VTERVLETVREAADRSIWRLDRNSVELHGDGRWLAGLGCARAEFASEIEA
jgi:hypothetical protein